MDHIEDSDGRRNTRSGRPRLQVRRRRFLRRVKVGARYQDRDQTVRYTTYNWGMLSEIWSGARPVNFGDTPATDSTTRYEFPELLPRRNARVRREGSTTMAT